MAPANSGRKVPHKSEITISDLPEAERSKVSRLVERLVTLGTEHQDAVDKLSGLEAQSKTDEEAHTAQLDDLRFGNATDVQRLNDVVAAVEGQRTSAFEMLTQYQTRLEEMAQVLRNKEEDEISGERKQALFANLSQLENVVESQKRSIESFERERQSTEQAHETALKMAADNLNLQERETKKKTELVGRADKRCAAIEMACSRLTKQITEMTRRDSVKQAEIDALKMLLAERAAPAAAPVAAPVAAAAPAPAETPSDSAKPKQSKSARQHQHSPPHFPGPVLKPAPFAVSSPKRKLESAISQSRGEAEEDGFDNQAAVAEVAEVKAAAARPMTAPSKRKGPFRTCTHSASASVLLAQSPARSTGGTSVETAASSASSRSRVRVDGSSDGDGDGSVVRRRQRPVVVMARHSMVNLNRPVDSSPPDNQRRTRTSTSSASARTAPASAPMSSTSSVLRPTTASRLQQAQAKGERSRTGASDDDGVSMGSNRSRSWGSKAKGRSSSSRDGGFTDRSYTVASTSVKAEQQPSKTRQGLDVTLGEKRQYDPALLDLLSAMDI